MASEPLDHPVVLFDGVCNLCSGSVQFILARDPKAHFRFASLQSDRAKELLSARGVTLPEGDPDSILLVDGERVYERSTAALRIARGMTFPWMLAWIFVIVPRPIRDLVYKWIAKNRYRWFGKSDTCWIPTPELRARFLA